MNRRRLGAGLLDAAQLDEPVRHKVLAVNGLIDTDVRNRVEPFDVLAADHYADVVTTWERAGQPISISDVHIAAICRVMNAALATRDTSDFTGTGVNLIMLRTRPGPDETRVSPP